MNQTWAIVIVLFLIQRQGIKRLFQGLAGLANSINDPIFAPTFTGSSNTNSINDNNDNSNSNTSTSDNISTDQNYGIKLVDNVMQAWKEWDTGLLLGSPAIKDLEARFNTDWRNSAKGMQVVISSLPNTNAIV